MRWHTCAPLGVAFERGVPEGALWSGEEVQEGLTLEVMQELNARVDLDREQPAAVATQYLQESGYIE